MQRFITVLTVLMLTVILTARPASAQTPLVHVANNSALTATAISAGTRVMRDGFYVAGDGGAAIYTASASSCSPSADNGVRVSASGGGCWLMDTKAIQPNILQWGAKADDATDIGPYIQLAYNANIGPIHVPAGVYYDNTQAVFSANTVPYFYGDGWAEYNQVGHCPSLAGIVGTWIHFKAPAMSVSPFLWTGPGQVAVGRGGFRDMAFCQDHPAPAHPWTPTVYKAVFQLNGVGNETDWEGLYFYGIYDAYSIINTARLHFDNIKGQVFHRLLTGPNGYVEDLFDLSQGNDFHIWPYWSGNTDVLQWQETNGVVFDIARMDTFQVENFFAFGYKSCLKLERSANGSPNQLQFGSFFCDASQFPVWATSTPGFGGTGATVTFANLGADALDLETALGVPETECVRSDGGGGSVIRIANLSCLGSTYSAVIAASTTGSDDIEISGASTGNVNCHGLSTCPGGSSPVFSAVNSAGFNAIKVGQSQIGTINGGGVFNTDIGGAYTNALFQYSGGYFINTAVGVGGGSVQMGNFSPISMLYIHGTSTITGALTVVLPQAGQSQAIITSDVDISNLTLNSPIGGGALGVCPHSLTHQHTLVVQWFNFGAATAWRCIAS